MSKRPVRIVQPVPANVLRVRDDWPQADYIGCYYELGFCLDAPDWIARGGTYVDGDYSSVLVSSYNNRDSATWYADPAPGDTYERQEQWAELGRVATLANLAALTRCYAEGRAVQRYDALALRAIVDRAPPQRWQRHCGHCGNDWKDCSCGPDDFRD